MYLEHLDSDTKLILTDYDNQRCLDVHLEHQKSPKINNVTYGNKDDEVSVSSNTAQIKNQLLQTKTSKATSSITGTSVTSSNAERNQTLFKIRTRG
jgi:hypothetical protein